MPVIFNYLFVLSRNIRIFLLLPRSSLSVGFNSTSVVILEDFVKGCFKMKPSDRCSTIFVKTLVVVLGLLALSLLFLIEKLGGVLSVSIQISRCRSLLSDLFKNCKTLYIAIQVTNSLAAIAAGTSFGVFTLGLLCPWANSKVRNKN